MNYPALSGGLFFVLASVSFCWALACWSYGMETMFRWFAEQDKKLGIEE